MIHTQFGATIKVFFILIHEENIYLMNFVTS